MEPLPESDKNAARNRARDELSLAWDETLANNPMTPRTRPILELSSAVVVPAGHRKRYPTSAIVFAVPGPSPHASVKVSPESAVRWTEASIVAENKVKLALGMVFLSAYSGERAFR